MNVMEIISYGSEEEKKVKNLIQEIEPHLVEIGPSWNVLRKLKEAVDIVSDGQIGESAMNRLYQARVSAEKTLRFLDFHAVILSGENRCGKGLIESAAALKDRYDELVQLYSECANQIVYKYKLESLRFTLECAREKIEKRRRLLEEYYRIADDLSTYIDLAIAVREALELDEYYA